MKLLSQMAILRWGLKYYIIILIPRFAPPLLNIVTPHSQHDLEPPKIAVNIINSLSKNPIRPNLLFQHFKFLGEGQFGFCAVAV